MSSILPLTREDKIRVDSLANKLNSAAKARDFKGANDAFIALSFILIPLNQSRLLYRYKLELFRIGIDCDETKEFEDSLKKACLHLDWNTPEWLEAHSLISILFLKLGRFEDAKLHINVVLENEHVIIDEIERDEFHKKFIRKLGEEAVLYTLKKNQQEVIDPQRLEREVMMLLVSETSETQITELIGSLTPLETAKSLFLIESIAREKLPLKFTERLPDIHSEKAKQLIGKTVFSAFKRRARAALCDPNSEVYKIWVNQGVGGLFGGKSILASLLAVHFQRYDIAIFSLAVPVTALIVKTGIEAVCEVTDPVL